MRERVEDEIIRIAADIRIVEQIVEEIVGRLVCGSCDEFFQAGILGGNFLLDDGKHVVTAVGRVCHLVADKLGIAGLGGSHAAIVRLPAGFLGEHDLADVGQDRDDVFLLAIRVVDGLDPAAHRNELAHQGAQILRRILNHELLGLLKTGHVVHAFILGHIAVVGRVEVGEAIGADSIIIIEVGLVHFGRLGFRVRLHFGGLDITETQVVGLLGTGDVDHGARGAGIAGDIGEGFAIGDDGAGLGRGDNRHGVDQDRLVVREGDDRGEVGSGLGMGILEDFDFLGGVTALVEHLEGGGAVGASLVLGDSDRQEVFVDAGGGSDGDPFPGRLGDIDLIGHVGTDGEGKLAAFPFDVVGLDNGLEDAALELEGADVSLALVVGCIDGDLGGLALGSGDLQDAGSVVGGNDLGRPVTDDADHVDINLIGSVDTGDSVGEGSGLAGLDAIVLDGREGEGEGLLLGDLDLGRTDHEDDVVIGLLVRIDIGGVIGVARQAEGLPGLAIVIGDHPVTVEDAELRGNAVHAVDTVFAVRAVVAGDRDRLAGVILQDSAVHGPDIDPVHEGDADDGRLAVDTVLTVLTIGSIDTIDTVDTVAAVLAVLAVPEGGGGPVGEGNHVTALGFHHGGDGYVVLNGTDQSLETRNVLLIELLDSLFENADAILDAIQARTDLVELALFGASDHGKRSERNRDDRLNRFSHKMID